MGLFEHNRPFDYHVPRAPDQRAIITLSGHWQWANDVLEHQMDLILVPHPEFLVPVGACSPALREGIRSRLGEFGYVIINNCPLLPITQYEAEAIQNRMCRDEFERAGNLKSLLEAAEGHWDQTLWLSQMEERLSWDCLRGTLHFSALDLQIEEAGRMVCALVSGFSDLIKNEEGDIISIIRPSENTLPDEISSQSNTEFAAHTDLTYLENPPKYIALFTLAHDGWRHAQNQFVSLKHAIPHLDQRTISVLSERVFRFSYPKRGGAHANQSGYVVAPVLTSGEDGKYHIRYRGDTVMAETPEGSQALVTLKNVFEQVRIGYAPQVGTAMIMRNDEVLHARTPFLGDRCALRVYANDPCGDDPRLL